MGIEKRIAELRKARGMTQEQLAQLLGTTRQAVSKWESGKSIPDLDYAIAIGTCFNVSMDYLLLGKKDVTPNIPAPTSNQQRKVVHTIFLSLGGVLACLLPLIAKIYRNFIFSTEGSALVDYCLYLWRWPLLGLTLFVFTIIMIGSWPFIKKIFRSIKTTK